MHQDQLGISLAEPVLEAVHWSVHRIRVARASLFFLSRRSTRAIDVDIGHMKCVQSRSGGLGPQGQFRAGRALPPPGVMLVCGCPRGFAGSCFSSSYLVLIRILVQDLDLVILVLDA